MKKSAGKKPTGPRQTRKATVKSPKAAEYVRCLLELHKLQAVLLSQLSAEIKA